MPELWKKAHAVSTAGAQAVRSGRDRGAGAASRAARAGGVGRGAAGERIRCVAHDDKGAERRRDGDVRRAAGAQRPRGVRVSVSRRRSCRGEEQPRCAVLARRPGESGCAGSAAPSGWCGEGRGPAASARVRARANCTPTASLPATRGLSQSEREQKREESAVVALTGPKEGLNSYRSAPVNPEGALCLAERHATGFHDLTCNDAVCLAAPLTIAEMEAEA